MAVTHASILAYPAVRRTGDWQSWRELARDAPPFLAPEFLALTAPLTTGTPMVALARGGERVVGALPFVTRDRELGAWSSDHTPGTDYLGSDEGLEAIWRTLAHDRSWDELFLRKLSADSALATRLPALARADGCPTVVRPAGRHRYFGLPGFEARLEPRFRKNLQRCGRKAGGLALERIVRPTRQDFDEALALEAGAWKATAGTHIASDARVAHLYRALGRLFGARSSLCFLRAAGRRVAALFTVEDARTLYALKLGYDPADAAIGPGHLMIWTVAADAERRGLGELNFVGTDDAWKQKWTDTTHELVSIRTYHRTARGLVYYGLREIVKPRLPDSMRDLSSPLRHGCQRAELIGVHTFGQRLHGRLGNGLGLRRHLRARKDSLGEASRFAAGSWVRVLDAERIGQTLDGDARLRGLKFVPVQWESCGRLYRVHQPVRRIRDDSGSYRPIARSVLLEGVSCAGDGPDPAGCGRRCPLFYRDEWLEAAPAPHLPPPGPTLRRHARVRGADEIAAGLDLFGRRDGLSFMPEMAAHATRRFIIADRLATVYEDDRWVPTRKPIYILEGCSCSGRARGCDRACALLWHEDWLLVEESR